MQRISTSKVHKIFSFTSILHGLYEQNISKDINVDIIMKKYYVCLQNGRFGGACCLFRLLFMFTAFVSKARNLSTQLNGMFDTALLKRKKEREGDNLRGC